MQEEYQCKKGTAILLDYSNGKRWLVVLLGKKGDGLKIFDTEKEARTYLETIIND